MFRLRLSQGVPQCAKGGLQTGAKEGRETGQGGQVQTSANEEVQGKIY